MCHHTDHHLDVVEQCMETVWQYQEILHSQRDELLLEFPDVSVYPPIPDPYASLTPAELATFGICTTYAPASSDDNDEEEANDDEETEDDE
jgi:hypothetical protein